MQAPNTAETSLRFMHLRTALIVLAATLVPMQAFAVFECNVKVHTVLVYANGDVNINHSGRNDYTVVCNLNHSFGGASPIVCATWFALLQQIKKKNGIANFYFNGEGSCASLATYGNTPTPVYIGDLTPWAERSA